MLKSWSVSSRIGKNLDELRKKKKGIAGEVTTAVWVQAIPVSKTILLQKN